MKTVQVHLIIGVTLEWCFMVSIDVCWDYFNMSRSLAAHETIYNRTINHVFQSKESFEDKLCIGGYCYNCILEFLFIASLQNESLVI